MAISNLSKLVSIPAERVFYTQSFRDVLLVHLSEIKKQPRNSRLEITQVEANRWKGDFHGLLRTKNIPVHLHWLLTVLNGLTCSEDYQADFLSILTCDIEYLQKLTDIHNTVYS